MFIPIFVEYLERNDRDGGWKALSASQIFILVVGTIGIALLMIYARPLAGFGRQDSPGPGEVDSGTADTLHFAGAVFPGNRRVIVGGASATDPLELFEDLSCNPEPVIQRRIHAIVEYLRQIQEK